MSFEIFLEGVGLLLNWQTLLWIILGILLGILLGALPGLGATIGMAILLPFTLPLGELNGLVFLISIYSGAMYGGSIAAILINAPGTSAAAATTFDGYPLARKGEAAYALSLSATSSALAGFLTVVTLILISPFLVQAILYFGSPEYFLIALLGLTMITVVAKGSMVKGLIAGFFGLALTTVGTTPMTTDVRYTFGYFTLYEGISFVAALIGLFAIAEMMRLSNESGGISKGAMRATGGVVRGFKTVFKYPVTLVKSAFIGMGIGSVPGAGSTVSNFISYTEAVRSSDDPDSFGTGNEVGVIASEASNNGTIGGSIIPAISFGIPGSAATAVLIGGLLMHGLSPGPELFDPDASLNLTYALFASLLITNVVILVVGLSLITRAEYLTRVDTSFIIPTVIVLSFLGAFALRGYWVDVISVVAFGFIGYYMHKYNYSPIAFVLGIVLGTIAERNLFRSLMLSDGPVPVFFTEPVSLIIVISIVLIFLTPVLKPVFSRLRTS